MDSAGLRELLTFYADAGVDEPLWDMPADRFAETQQEAEQRAAGRQQPARPAAASAGNRPAPSPATPKAAVPDDAQAARAREIAAGAANLDELRAQLEAFDGCNLKTTAKSTVFADGNPQASIMLVGEAPGRDEDLQGLPFVGRSGKLLDRILAAIGLDRSSVYISNVIAWRPPGNRDPSPLETEICRPFIERHIELVAPKVLVTLGNPSTKLLLRTQTGIMRMRGNWAVHRTPSGSEIPTMPTLHPAYLLRNPAHKALAWRDFLEIRAKLDAVGSA
ncbi:uracil-DNA glycosylase [Nitratireductor pacificus]|uniref:Type-4 uracil-DNA glycosylase n=1 Tax=Nitratireductor pacificus pht-3B TaxID=391937 RepID=K2MGB9_9HYPH|nr:uracil-DNA glycosylase [Nitratireductor pacificus]EKF19755.1 phage SPO1 DNA polymerase-related protein [Nitratireductor pacificus pht-3B]